MKRTLISIICIASLIFLISGCGSQAGTSGQGSTEVRPKEPVTAEAETQAVIAGDTKADESVKETSAAGNTKANNSNGSLISEKEAKAIALKDAGVAESDITNIRIKLDKDDGIQEYEVEFYVGNKEYDYDINASTGEIISKDMDIDDDFNKSGNSGKSGNSAQAAISEEEAKSIALKDAGVNESDITSIRIKLDEDDGILEYDVEFYTGDKEYDYEINASTGEIISMDMEIEKDFYNGNSGTSAKTAVTEAEAKKIALAKVPNATEKDIRIKLDYEDDKTIYEGSIVYGGMEYDFEIDANSGTILEWEQEKED